MSGTGYCAKRSMALVGAVQDEKHHFNVLRPERGWAVKQNASDFEARAQRVRATPFRLAQNAFAKQNVGQGFNHKL